MAPTLLEGGCWRPLPAPMGDLRGSISADSIERRVRAHFEFRFGRGNRTWSYDQGPWIAAERAAQAAGVGPHRASLIRKLMWLFYRNRWPLQFAAGCGWGAQGPEPLIVAALADPVRARARAELLILTGGLQRPAHDGDLEEIGGDALLDNFYASP